MSGDSLGGAFMNGTDGLFSAIMTPPRGGVVLETATEEAAGRENAGVKEETKAIAKMLRKVTMTKLDETKANR